jgi:hypothetical protein
MAEHVRRVRFESAAEITSVYALVRFVPLADIAVPRLLPTAFDVGETH